RQPTSVVARPARPGAVLPGIRTVDGALEARVAAPDPRAALRGIDGQPGGGEPPADRLLRAGVGRALPALPRDRAGGANRELASGAAADVPQLGGQVEAVRGPAGAAAGGAPGRRGLSRVQTVLP